jgi:hypothetical protein
MPSQQTEQVDIVANDLPAAIEIITEFGRAVQAEGSVPDSRWCRRVEVPREGTCPQSR